AFDLPEEAIGAALSGAEPGPYRGRRVGAVGSVEFIDDSKATNPHAALAALEGLDRVVLIAGGVAKGIDLTPLRAAAPSLVGVVAIGEAAPMLAEVFTGIVPVHLAPSMEQAVAVAARLSPQGGRVLLAPACASFDMFRDYRDRGDQFADAVARLAGTGSDDQPDGAMKREAHA
ncbi:MAG TPA: cyanophycin synthetase, partial [Actinomycetota bacterium]